MAKKNKNFEEAMNRLEEIAEFLEKEEVSLEKSVQLYKEGMEISLYCHDKLENIKQEITIIQKKADGSLEETDFHIQEVEEDGI